MKSSEFLTIQQVTPQGSDAVLVTFGVDPEQAARFAFEPGQYLTLAGGPEEDLWRCYSITSEPVPGSPISVLIRRTKGGRVSNWLCDTAAPGRRLRILPPAGRFTLERADRPVVLFAGGSGIAPIFSLARAALTSGAKRVALFYANRDRATAMLVPELMTLAQQSAGRLDLTLWYDSERGLPSPADLAGYMQAHREGDVYLCGPEPFMHSVQATLLNLGVGPDVIHREDFDAPAEVGAGTTSNPSQLTVALGNREHTVPVKAGETLLSAMLGVGLRVPHACKMGECASCICQLVEGEVGRLNNAVLDEEDVRRGLLVACRTLATSPKVKIRFS